MKGKKKALHFLSTMSPKSEFEAALFRYIEHVLEKSSEDTAKLVLGVAELAYRALTKKGQVTNVRLLLVFLCLNLNLATYNLLRRLFSLPLFRVLRTLPSMVTTT